MKESNTRFVGKVLYHLSEVPSTNAFALELLSKTKPAEGTVISAHHQTHGRGQIGSYWESAPGENLTLSFIFYPHFLHPTQQHFLGKIFALAARDLIGSHIPSKPALVKWPNDIIAGSRKIGGILVQNSIQGEKLQYTVGGIGLNINQCHFRQYAPPATSLALETGKTFDTEQLRDELCNKIEVYYEILRSGAYHSIDQMYLNHLMLLNRPAVFQRQSNRETFEGHIRGVSDSGLLIVEHHGISETFGLKEIRLLTFSN